MSKYVYMFLYEYFVYRKKISPENTFLLRKIAYSRGDFCVFLFYALFRIFRGNFYPHKSGCDNGCTDRGLDYLGNHIPPVIYEREHPL